MFLIFNHIIAYISILAGTPSRYDIKIDYGRHESLLFSLEILSFSLKEDEALWFLRHCPLSKNYTVSVFPGGLGTPCAWARRGGAGARPGTVEGTKGAGIFSGLLAARREGALG
jgi:hypothetical protein